MGEHSIVLSGQSLPDTITVIALDIANTLELVKTNYEIQVRASHTIRSLIHDIGFPMNIEVSQLRNRLRDRFRRLHAWRLAHSVEPTPEEMWTKWMLSDYSKDQILSIADKLTEVWMCEWYQRQVIPNCEDILSTIRLKNYRLACISNTLSTKVSRNFLHSNNLMQFFESVVLSSETGFRKPHPMMFETTAQQMNVSPESICYVGDQLSRDIVGAINANYGYTILLGAESSGSWHDKAVIWPDLQLKNLSEIITHI